jgi:two-component system, chemotaxis family, chemotaxis protein CheY
MAQKVLVVDDDTPIRNMVVRLLQFSGGDLEMESAEDGPAALELLAEKDFDLLLIDYTMPEMSGVEAIQALRKSQRNASIPVIMLTARAENHHLIESLEGGASYFLAKPFEPQELLNTVGLALGLTLTF